MARTDPQAAESGEWWREKHDRVRRYVDISSAVRRMFICSGYAGATYIDPFCGPPHRETRGSGVVFDSGALAACRKAAESATPFTEVHIGDLERSSVEQTAEALSAMGVNVRTYVGPAQDTVPQICEALHPKALHFAFLDPWDIKNLDYRMIVRLAALERMDIIAHVSAQDIQRNLQYNLDGRSTSIDQFAPGWRDHVPSLAAKAETRAAIYEYWTRLIDEAGMRRSDQAPLIRGSNRQRLYYLMFLAKHEKAREFWEKIEQLSGEPGRLF